MMYSIYTLSDPRDACIRYVGLSNNVQRRFAFHLASLGSKDKDQWIQGMLYAGVLPMLVVVETNIPTKEDAQEREKYWILHYLNLQCDLFNVQHKPTPTKSKSSITQLAEEDLRQLLKEHGWTLYKRQRNGREFFYALKWKQGQVYISSGSKLPAMTKEEVLRKIGSVA